MGEEGEVLNINSRQTERLPGGEKPNKIKVYKREGQEEYKNE